MRKSPKHRTNKSPKRKVILEPLWETYQPLLSELADHESKKAAILKEVADRLIYEHNNALAKTSAVKIIPEAFRVPPSALDLQHRSKEAAELAQVFRARAGSNEKTRNGQSARNRKKLLK